MYQSSSRDRNAVYIGETGCNVRTRKREHIDAVKTFNTIKSALSQHLEDFDHRIDWDNVKILKSESHAHSCRDAEIFLINQKARSLNMIDRNDGRNFSAVCSMFTANNRCLICSFPAWRSAFRGGCGEQAGKLACCVLGQGT